MSRRKNNDHKIKKLNNASRTPGKDKGDSCKTWPDKKYYATSPKAYKERDYKLWHEMFISMNKG